MTGDTVPWGEDAPVYDSLHGLEPAGVGLQGRPVVVSVVRLSSPPYGRLRKNAYRIQWTEEASTYIKRLPTQLQGP